MSMSAPPGSRRAALGGGGGHRGISGRDEAAQRAANADAPVIPDLWSRVLALFRPYRGALVLTAVLVVLTASAGVVPPLIIERIFDDALFPPGDAGPQLVLLAELVALVIVIFIATAALGVWQTYVTASVGNRVTGDLRTRLFDKLQSMDLAFFTRTKTGVIQSRLQNDVGGVSGVLTTFVSSIIGNTVTVLASLVAMILLDWRLTLVAVILMPALVAIQRRVGQVRARLASRTQESLSEMTAITQETLSVSGILLSKVYNRQRLESERYGAENANQIDLQVRLSMSGQWFFGLVTVIMSSVPAVIYLVAGLLIARANGQGVEPTITAGTIVAFTAIQGRLLFPLMALMRVALEIQTSKALFARIFEYLDLTPAIVDSPDARDVASAPGPMGWVAFRDVVFRYPDAGADRAATLDGVSFVAEPGQTVAFVGPSGAGKTTIVYLAARLHEASSGAVEFAGADVRELTHESIVDRIGVVSQETYLFHASIAENLRYARPEASDADLEQACRAANIHDQIMTFEHGYDTIVGERGYRLSGGEKQRIAIARVLLKDPPVLLLDEATSALDTVSERVVQAALDRAAEGRTTLVVAHRLSTIADADVIHVVDGGRIVETGTHGDLIAAGGLYARLAAEQRRD
ncbi:ABC transporter ATP-binding protein [Demequina sp. NBRC 110051]|uniref:ABC transporter ATP-binding protein n=1 Tax=Demequina sp. NBRC 110051 TaxID=1570340 RepID=UPI001F2AFD89|nr:ABC transporter ATP-binding protein [Demequina sp. NBRC 110051]